MPEIFESPLAIGNVHTFFSERGKLLVKFTDIEDPSAEPARQFYAATDELTVEPVDLNGIEGFEVVDASKETDNRGVVFYLNGKAYYFYYECAGMNDDDLATFKALEQSIHYPKYMSADIPDYPTLQKGSRGEDVKTLQQRLKDLFWLDGTADGDYGNKTKSAVERFQEELGLESTGVADARTQYALYSDEAPSAVMEFESVFLRDSDSNIECEWTVNGQVFRIGYNQSKTLDTPWGRFVFHGNGDYEKVD